MKNALILLIALLLFVSCKKDKAGTPLPTIVKEWTISLSAKYENPAPPARTETGTATLQLLSDNSLNYIIAVNGVAAGDALVAAHLHTGDVISNGPVILDFKPSFNGGNASGNIGNLRTTLIDSLNNAVNNIYFNVHSTQVASGLVRGAVNSTMEMAADVILSAANEVPVGTSAATGLALIRITADKKLFSKITVTNLEAGDALTAAHIHKAATGVNGPVILGLCSGAGDFGIVKTFDLADPLFTSIKTDAIYVNVHSTAKPGGIIRGQIR